MCSQRTNSFPSNGKIIRLKQLVELIKLSRSCIYDKLNRKSPRYDNSFPAPISLGASAIGWPEHEVHAWIEERMQTRQNKGAEHELL